MKRLLRRLRPRGEAMSLGVALIALTLLALGTGLLARVDTLIYDMAMRLRHAPPPDDIVIVAIDDKSLRKLGQWPWPRALHAELVTRLSEAGARVIGLDIMFSEPGTDDRALASAIAASGRVVLPVFPDSSGADSLREVMPVPPLANAANKLGHVDVELDEDSIARSVYLKGGLGSPVWPSFALAMLEHHNAEAWQSLPGTRHPDGTTTQPGMWLRDYRLDIGFDGPPGHIRRISYADALSDTPLIAGLAGKFVLVGMTAAGLGRTLATPVSGTAQPMAGVEFHANALANLRHESWIRSVTGAPHALLLALVALLPALLYPRFDPRQGMFTCAALLLATLTVPVGLHTLANVWIAPAPALLALLVSYPLWSWWRIEATARTLRAEREIARATLNAIGDAVVTTDRNGVISYMNPVAERLSEHPQREAIGRHISSVFWSPQQFERDKLAAAITQALHENRAVRSPSHATLTRRLGDPLLVRITASPIDPIGGVSPGAVIALHDLTETQTLTRQISHQATHDALTELPNRELLVDRLAQAIAGASRHGGIVALMFVDIDGFKHVNGSIGHAGGDELLRQLALRLDAVGRADDTIARWDGDQFAIMAAGLASPELAAQLARKFLGVNDEPYIVQNQEIHLTASVGISLYPDDAGDIETLLRHADVALHRSKQHRHNTVGFYDKAFDAQAQHRLELESALRKALRGDELELYYQPQIDLGTGQVSGVEALLRWRHPTRGLILPGEFVPMSEESALIEPLGAWVMESACRQAQAWRAAGRPLPVAINVSARQLAAESFVATTTSALAASGAAAHDVTLEITESAVLHDPLRAGERLAALRARGVRIALDDFGTGYASLANLKTLPVDHIKIDRSFVADLEADLPLIRAVVTMAQGMQLGVIAEGVETRAQLDLLRRLDCHTVQGFLLAPPLPLPDLERWLAARHASAPTTGVTLANHDSNALH